MAAEADVRSQKDQQRAQLRQFRADLRAHDHAHRSDQIAGRLKTLAEVRDASCVHVYWPIPERMEVDTRPLIAWLYTHKKQIVLPVVVTTGRGGEQHLEHRRFTGEDALVRSQLGIHEPLESEFVPVEDIDVVVVPALGVDRRGNRLGYGRGHYDRFLSGMRVPTVCPVFRECVRKTVPTESHDVPVHIIVTEREVIRVDRL